MINVVRWMFAALWAVLLGAAVYCKADGADGSALLLLYVAAWAACTLRPTLRSAPVRSEIIGGRARPRRALSGR